jgi:chromosome segregation ATPase
MLIFFIPIFMWERKTKTKVKQKETTLKELIKKSKAIRKNIDTIMSAFKRIEKHVGEMKENLDKKDLRQQGMSETLEKLIKNMKQLDASIKEKKK